MSSERYVDSYIPVGPAADGGGTGIGVVGAMTA